MLNLVKTYSDKTLDTNENYIDRNGRAKMAIQKFSENVLLVDLPFKEPQIGEELKSINEIVSNRDDCDVIVDFFRVEIITSSSLSNLIILRRLLREHGRELILCNVAIVTKYIFTVTGLDTVFDFIDDKFAALAVVECAD